MSTADAGHEAEGHDLEVHEREVIVERRGSLGVLTLNRPVAINALTHTMCASIAGALHGWAHDDSIRAVLVRGAGERGLCAGGDIVAIYEDARAGGHATLDFWRDEYLLNAQIADYGKPYIAVMDGIVMGGGVGISAHGSHRIVTERSKIAMPEVGIGFIPDVGGTYLLARAPGELGTHLALTTGRMNAADAIAAGFADHYVQVADLPALLAALETSTDITAAINGFAQSPPASALLDDQEWIDACYAADTVEQIVANLRSHGGEPAGKAAAAIESKSPAAVKVALRSLRLAKEQGLHEALDVEYRVSTAAFNSHDLVEGIRAQVIDKDRNPAWDPATLDQVSTELVDSYFRPLGADELGLGADELGSGRAQRRDNKVLGATQ